MMMSLVEYYEKFRIGDKSKIFDVEYLESLYLDNDKKLQFIIFYYFITKQEIPIEVRYSTIISTLVFTLVNTIDDQKMVDYYNSYFNLGEFEEQWKKIHSELRTFSMRHDIYKKMTP